MSGLHHRKQYVVTLNDPIDREVRVPPPEGKCAELRILETTDVHANLLAYDYHADREVQTYGLTRIATLIHRARRERDNVLLFDNGDYLQGTPLSDLTAQPANGWEAEHPVITAMNALRYDAAGLGNHEFNFGLPRLLEVISQADFPVTCANALTHLGVTPDQDVSLMPPYVLLKRMLVDQSGASHPLTIGVLSLVPPQTAVWDQFHLADRLWLRGIEETARRVIPQIRAAGADLVIALAHAGIDSSPATAMMENAALPLAQVPGLDAMLAGHSHQVFPNQQFENMPGVDLEAGTLHGTPTVMAGFRGSHLGVIDLSLQFVDGRWRVTSSKSEARPVQPTQADACPACEDTSLSQKLAPAHRATMQLTQQPLGRSEMPLHSYLALVGQSNSVQIVTRAQAAAVRDLLGDRLDPDLPVLSASASFKVGERGGPNYYSDVPAGPVFLRHAADLYPFPNTLCVLQADGAQLRDWLERAATVFNTIHCEPNDQPLRNADVPGHAFDVIDGLTYQIDLSQPARYDANGNANTTGGPGRIRALCHRGQPVRDADRFVIATNNYRVFGGGPYKAASPDQILFAGNVPIIDLIADHIRTSSPMSVATAPIWQFAPHPGARVVFDTGPGLRAYGGDIAARSLVDLGDTDAGFARFSMPL